MTHKAVVVKVPQDVTAEEWALAAAYAYSFRHTVTASHDDMLTVLRGGRPDSYVKLLWPKRQPEVAEMIAQAGYFWEAPQQFAFPALKLAHPFEYRYAVSSRFNDWRPYANNRHEGIDWVVLGPGSDKPVGVLATLPGLVDKVGFSAGGYGNYVRVLSWVDGYDVVLWYGHLDRVFVKPYQNVAVGDVLGEVGNTGNSSGEHLHLTIAVPFHGLKGYVVDDVIDPAPFVPSAAQVATLPLYAPMQVKLDLLPYLFGDGRSYQVDNARGTTEVFQSQQDGKTWYQLKAWGDLSRVNYESFYLRDGLVYRDIDTSPGGGRYYRVFAPDGSAGAPWVPRMMAVGESYTSQKRVQFYFESDCKPSSANSGNVMDTIRLNRVHATLRLKTGMTVHDVVELEWVDGGELYYYARGFGLVAWERRHQDANSPAWSAMSKMRPDVGKLTRLRIPCMG